MKPISIETLAGKTVITVEYPFLFFFKRKRRYMAADSIVADYWTWLELPHRRIVFGHLSFQLDEWKKHWNTKVPLN